MSRSTAIALVVLGAALAGFVFSSTAIGPADDGESRTEQSVAAGPQTAELSWRETFGPAGQQLVFEVERIRVLEDGWKAWVRLTNNTSVAYDVGDPRATIDRSFGLMLFETGDVTELEERNSQGALPGNPLCDDLRAEPAEAPRAERKLERRDLRSGLTRRRELGSRRLRNAARDRVDRRRPRGQRRLDHRQRVPPASLIRGAGRRELTTSALRTDDADHLAVRDLLAGRDR